MQNWPHSPLHRTLVKGLYMVTAATYQKVLLFNSEQRLQFLHDELLSLQNNILGIFKHGLF
jgi:hypothetical protein